MKYSTEDLYEKYVSGHTINEISKETGIGIWALYKRFQRMGITELSEEDDFGDNMILENSVVNTDEFQTRTNRWPNKISAVLIFAAILVGFFLYRKQDSKMTKNTK